jgi:N-acetylmuramoyl-L-alanine amidase
MVIKTNSYAQSKSYILARTTGNLPFLEYGIGDDRLGGAKMTYLDSNILLKVTDSFKTDYKVQLSQYHFAYIAKESVKLLKKESTVSHHNNFTSNSWKVYGDSLFDYIAISLNERLPYNSRQLINPSKITVDLFGVTTNTNWVTQLKTAKEIKNAWYEQPEDDVLRVNIELKHAQHWGYSIFYDSLLSKLIIKVKRQPNIADIKKLRIAIDAGHGGENGGATGVTSFILEKDYTLLMAKQLATTVKTSAVKTIMVRRC